jgi:ABC-type nitrate/sulfonate/bicarbonate transport system permease component
VVGVVAQKHPPLPHLFTSSNRAVTIAVIGASVAVQSVEGYSVLMATALSLTPLALAALLLSIAVGIALFLGIGVVERRVMDWRKRSPQSALRFAHSAEPCKVPGDSLA